MKTVYKVCVISIFIIVVKLCDVGNVISTRSISA